MKPVVRQIKQEDSVLIFDDPTQEKAYTDDMKLKNNHFTLRTKRYAKAARQAHVEL